MYRYAAPADHAKALGIGSGLDGGARLCGGRSGEKGKTKAENLGKFNAMLLRAGTKEIVRKRGEQSGAVAAGAIGVNATAVGESFQGGQRVLDDAVIGGAGQARDKARTTCIVVGVTPIGVSAASRALALRSHACLLNGCAYEVQRRF